MAHDFQTMYPLPLSETYMDSHFYVVTNYLRTKDVIKGWMKEPSKFWQTPNNGYKTKSLKKSFQYLIVLCCWIYGQKSTETFPKGWEFLLNQVVNDGKAFNWLDLFSQRLKIHVTNAKNPPKGK